MSEIIITLLLDLMLTVFGYLFYPVICCLRQKKYTKKKIKRILIINALIVWFIFKIIQMETTGEMSNGAGGMFLWSIVAYRLMIKHCIDDKQKPNSPQQVQTRSNESENSMSLSKESQTEIDSTITPVTMASNENKNINIKLPEGVKEVCLSAEGSQPSHYGNYNIQGSDIILEAPQAQKANPPHQSSSNNNAAAQARAEEERCKKEEEEKIRRKEKAAKVAIVVLSVVLVYLVYCFWSMFQPTTETDKPADTENMKNQLFQEGYEEGYKQAEKDILGPFSEGDKYQPIYIQNKIIEDLASLDEWTVNNQYSPEEYANMLATFYDEQSYWMTAEQKETFTKIISYVLEADWIISHIAHEMEYQPAGNQEDLESKPSNDFSENEQNDTKPHVEIIDPENVLEFFRENNVKIGN